jgi:hypothetical protein
MAPTAVSVPAISRPTDLGVALPAGPVLVIGSLGTAQNGKYQSLVTNLDTNASGNTAERQMLDRLMGGGSVISSLTNTYALS